MTTRPVTGQPRRAPFHYGWIVIWSAFVALLVTSGVRFSFSALIRPWEAEFGWTRDTISLVGSLSLIVWGSLPPFAGKLADRYGGRLIITAAVVLAGVAAAATALIGEYWQLLLTFGVVAGIGAACGSPVTAAPLAARWFVEKRGLAIGIVSAGISGSQTLVVPLVIFLIVSLGWRTTLLGVGLTLLLLLSPLLFFLLRSNPSDLKLRPYGAADAATSAQAALDDQRSTSLLEAVRTRPYWLLGLPYFICGFTTLGLITTHLVPYTVGDLRLTEGNAAQALAVLGIFDVAGTILAGYLSDRFGRRTPLAITYLLRGISYFVLLNAGNPALLVFWSALYGMTDLATVPLVAALSGDMYGRRSLGTIFGSMFLMHQLGAAAGAAFGGFAFQQFGSYQPAMLTGMTLLFAASAMSFAIREKRPALRPKLA